MVSEEVTRNLGGVIASRYSRLESRREAVDKINKMFGTNWSVHVAEEIDYGAENERIQFSTMTEIHNSTEGLGNDGRSENSK